jgi:hypothetical protein
MRKDTTEVDKLIDSYNAAGERFKREAQGIVWFLVLFCILLAVLYFR